jgi:hypothetical protein
MNSAECEKCGPNPICFLGPMHKTHNQREMNIISSFSTMKSTDISWRGQIGRYSNIKATRTGKKHVLPYQSISSMVLIILIDCTYGYPDLAIIVALLLIAGVERNPGPVSEIYKTNCKLCL